MKSIIVFIPVHDHSKLVPMKTKLILGETSDTRTSNKITRKSQRIIARTSTRTKPGRFLQKFLVQILYLFHDWDSKFQEDSKWCELDRETRFYDQPYKYPSGGGFWIMTPQAWLARNRRSTTNKTCRVDSGYPPPIWAKLVQNCFDFLAFMAAGTLPTTPLHTS
jgi:hypothetical protein